jgi:antirestriction protein ArdC
MASVTDIDKARARRRQHLTTAIATLRSEEGFRSWLAARRVFHRYSPMNVLWIVSQCPRATHVAGFGTWRSKLGYQVRKGEKGIAINVPRPYRVSDQDREGGEEAEVRRVAFRVGHVFDTLSRDHL